MTKKNLAAVLVALVMTIFLAACGAGVETTLTGRVVSVDGTVISLMEMDTGNMGGERPEMPEGPEGMTPPEGMTMQENGEMPDFGDMGGMGFGNFDSDAETNNVDISDAHISLEIDGGKASGSMDDIKAGTFVTITMNGKGKITNVLVSSRSGFGGDRR